MFGFVFGADGEGVEQVQREGEVDGLVLAIAEVALAEDFHADNAFACCAHFPDDADDGVRIGIHESADGIDTD